MNVSTVNKIAFAVVRTMDLEKAEEVPEGYIVTAWLQEGGVASAEVVAALDLLVAGGLFVRKPGPLIARGPQFERIAALCRKAEEETMAAVLRFQGGRRV